MVRRLRAVALAVSNPDGDILMLEELTSKPYLGKLAGMRSIPMETKRPDEPDAAALARLLDEEAAGLDGTVAIDATVIGCYRIVPHVWVRLYGARCAVRTVPTGGDADIGNHAWIRPADALGLWLRRGAREMITDSGNGCRGIVRRHCQPP